MWIAWAAATTVTTTAGDTVTVVTGGSGSGGAAALLLAVLGGAIGVVITALARALGLPSDVRTHDAQIADRDAMIGTWIADRNYRLSEDSEESRSQLSPRPPARTPDGTPQDTFHEQDTKAWNDAAHKVDEQIAQLRADALHEYRDETRRAGLDRARILASEGWPHRAWRRVSRTAEPEFETPSAAVPLIDAWRQASHLSDQGPVQPDDATKRTLTQALSTVSPAAQ